MKSLPAFRFSLHYVFVFTITLGLFACSAGSTSTTEAPIEEENTGILKATNLRPLRELKFESTPERIARGRYLTEGPLWCFNCHTERDSTKAGRPPFWDRKGSGALIYKTDSTHLYAPNITSDKKTGIGNFTDDMIARAIREGMGHDDRALQAMPWWTFRGLTDEDVASIVTYLRTLPPIENRIPKRKLGEEGEKSQQAFSAPLNYDIEELDLSDQVSRGKYLVGVSDCVGCHTGWYKRNPGVFGGGNPIGHDDHLFSSNITSDSTGIGAWSLETFVYVMKNGKGKSGALDYRMPWASFKNMSNEDLAAIYAALKTTYPVKHMVNSKVKPTLCEVCGLEHGLGDQNKIVQIKPYKSKEKIPADIAGTYLWQIFQDTLRVKVEKGEISVTSYGKENKLIQISPTEYIPEDGYAPLHFVRDSNNKVVALQYSDLNRSFKKMSSN
jgi:mono/diheme cytochrome c family protein